MRIVFFGTPQFAVPCLERLLQERDRHAVLGVVTQPDKRRGRGNHLTPSPVKAIALAHHLPVWQPARIKKDPETLAQLEALQADVFVVVAYGQILSPQILAMPHLGCVNVHGSLLPAYRGAAPIQWAIANGERETGVTTMLMDEGMDTGAMLLKAAFPIALLDNAHTVAERMAALGAELLLQTLTQLGTTAMEAIAQDSTQATYAPLIQKTDYTLDWTTPALHLHNRIRGFYPHCIASFRGEPLKILGTLPLDSALDLSEQSNLPDALRNPTEDLVRLLGSVPEVSPGRVIALIKNEGPLIATGQGGLLLRQVQPAGKKAMSGWDFVNGLRVTIGESLNVTRVGSIG